MENPIVVLETNKGEVEVEVFLKESPITAQNFINLTEEGFYNGVKFHRVIKDFVIQGGDPLTKQDDKKHLWGTGGSNPIKDEFIPELSNVKGTLSMANSGPNSGSSQFFINLKDNTFLDWDKEPQQSKHPVFGKVIKGFEVVEEISKVEVETGDIPKEHIIIIRAYVK